MWELPFEYLLAAQEGDVKNSDGTPAAAPAGYLGLQGMVLPGGSYATPSHGRGTLEASYGDRRTREMATWEGEGNADPDQFHNFGAMLADDAPTPTQPDGVNAPNTYLWEFLSSNITRLAVTLWGGDPNSGFVFEAPFGVLEELSLSADTDSEDATSMSANGQAHFPGKVTPPALPAMVVGPVLSPSWMECWLDSGASAIGTTPLAATLIRAEHTFPGALSYKYGAQGPGAAKTFSKVGYNRRRITTTFAIEVEGTWPEYDLYANETPVKLRIRHNGPQIGTDEIGASPAYYYIEVDTYGLLRLNGMPELQGTNRLMEFTIESEVNASAGHSWRLGVQNMQSALTI